MACPSRKENRDGELNMDSWNQEDVEQFLKEYDLPEDVRKRFKDEGINGKALALLTKDDLRELGIKKGPAVILLDAILRQKHALPQPPDIAPCPKVTKKTRGKSSDKTNLDRGYILQENAIRALGSQQDVLSFMTDKSSTESCYLSCIAPKGKCSELEKNLGILCLSSEEKPDARQLWKKCQKQQGHVYECFTDDMKKEYSFIPDRKHIYNSFDEDSSLISPSAELLTFKDVEGSELFWITIVEKTLLKDDTPTITLSVKNSQISCTVEFAKSSVHATYVINPFTVTFLQPAAMYVEAGIAGQQTTDIKLQQSPRKFQQSGRDQEYEKGHQLSVFETGRKDLIQRAHEFKLFRMKADELKRSVDYFVSKTLCFACGCLNSRTNGTIHFGIADGDSNLASQYGHTSREVVGFPVKDHDRFISELSKFIQTKFGENGSVANNCISPPAFVRVRNEDNLELYVIEVDVEPKNVHTNEKLFEVGLSDGEGVTAYERKGPNTVMAEKNFASLMHKLDEERKMQETNATASKIQKSVYQPKQADILKKRLCAGKDFLADNVYRILVLTKPHSKDKQLCANFLISMKWYVVIDFDCECRIRHQVYGDKKPQGRLYCAEDLKDEEVRDSVLDQQAWILANGSSEDGKPAFDYKGWFESERNKCLSNFVETISSHFPRRLTTVIFLLFSKTYKSELYLFQEFRKQYTGLSQLIYVSESKDIADPWENRLAEDIGRENLLSTGVVGLPWIEFNEQIKQLTGQSVNNTFLIPTANGVGMPSDRQYFDPDILYPLSLHECDYLEDLESTQQQEKSADEEMKFYSGNNVSWENFWFTEHNFNHVLKRDVLQEAIEKTEDLLQKDIEEGRVFSLEIKHEVGAGVTTLSKNILWHFAPSSKCRCCVVKQITNHTSASLLQLWSHTVSEGSEHLPVLALLDGFPREIVESLQADVTQDVQKCPATKKPVIVFIKTRMYLTLPQGEYIAEKTVLLKQKLSQKEQSRFQKKLNDMQLSKHHKAFNLEHLISFMIMKNNYNPQYIRSVAEKSYDGANEREQKLLKYLSLISMFGYGPVFEAAFDPLASSVFCRTRLLTSWIEDAEESTKVLLKKDDMSNNFGTGHGISVVHRLISQEIIGRVGSERISEVVLEFLQDVVNKINPSYFTSRHLLETVKQMMINRQNEEGDTGLFSKMILGIQQTDIRQASKVLEGGFDIFREAVFKQQLARLWFLSFDESQDKSLTMESVFQTAKDYAKEAVQMEPENSHFLDTVGRIHKKEFAILSDQPSSHWTSEDILQCVDLASQAIKWFKRSQKYMAKGDKNYASVYGEFRMMAELLSYLDRAVKGGGQTLQKFLISQDKEMCPQSFLKYADELSCFRERFHYCIRSINEEKSVFKTSDDETQSSKHLSKIFHEGIQIYRRHFCRDIDPEFITDMAEFDQNRYVIDMHIFGDYFRTVFNLVRVVKHNQVSTLLSGVLEKLKRNLVLKPGDEATQFATTTVSMALHSPYGPVKMNREESEREYIEIYNVLCRWERKQVSKDFPSIYPLLFKVMFLWPREDNPIKPKYTDYEEASRSLKGCWQTRVRSSESEPSGLHPKYDRTNQNRPPSTLFYLGKGHGLDVFVHVNALPRASDGKIDWESPETESKLRRIEGRRETISEIYVQNPNNPSALPLVVHYIDKERREFGRETLTFYIGFSWNGPIATGVRRNDYRASKSHTPTYNTPTVAVSTDCKYEENRRELRRVKRQLRDIDTLEKKTQLNEEQKTKVARKDGLLKLKAELQKKQGDDRDPFE